MALFFLLKSSIIFTSGNIRKIVVFDYNFYYLNFTYLILKVKKYQIKTDIFVVLTDNNRGDTQQL